MQFTMTRRYRFCAAHRLHTDHLTPEENRTAFGKCNNPNGHGHNYVVLVTVRSGANEGAVALERLDRIVEETIVERFDHQDLNQDSEFAALTTTGENLVKLIWNLLAPKLPAGILEKVGVIETRDNYFEYAAPTGPR
ncbi:6-carboxy-5,6,7,8-tetrahydropterin synthase [Nitrospira japonica]|uniref:6-carboxy-5,6,7,8-tetrahydropterin synthase n=1 Tax=Nitrospira japonica TaxID=1325564 RepID=A0A1W1I0P8_9BACT|nr:6-carboxytetrahydropterin synthase [Nitrospira japonica]SLM46578.1 6-carboxy-5,6,7,8-tetrahydropterin synthase [Nitrospira japonica]